MAQRPNPVFQFNWFRIALFLTVCWLLSAFIALQCVDAAPGNWLGATFRRNHHLAQHPALLDSFSSAFRHVARDKFYPGRREFFPDVFRADVTLGYLHRGEALTGRLLHRHEGSFRAEDLLRPGSFFSIVEDRFDAGPIVIRPTVDSTIIWLPGFHDRIRSSARNPLDLELWYSNIRDVNISRRRLIANSRMRISEVYTPERIRMLIQALSRLYGNDDGVFESPMTHDDLADLMWSHREAMSRGIKKLEIVGQLRRSKTEYEVANGARVKAWRYELR